MPESAVNVSFLLVCQKYLNINAPEEIFDKRLTHSHTHTDIDYFFMQHVNFYFHLKVADKKVIKIPHLT